VRTFRSQAALVLVTACAMAPQLAAQSNKWAAARCDLKPGHFLVNSGLLYLKSATESRFEDQKQKDLNAAKGVLTQALTTGGQEKNPAAWYYLGRYYVLTEDLAGADSAFARAEALKADCAEDIVTWRKYVWVPTLNAGIAAWQASNVDSAIKAFRRANQILQTDPRGFKYLASLLYNAGQVDSALVYFKRTVEIAARDTAFLQDRKDALFNLARLYHSQRRWAEAEATYREYLKVVPNDAEGMAALGSVLSQTGQRDSAFALYRRIIARGDSVGALALFRAGVEIYQGVPEPPDTAPVGNGCRADRRAKRLPPARIRAECDDSTKRLMRAHEAAASGIYKLAAEAFEGGLKINPYYRDGLFNMANTYLTLNDSAKLLPIAQRLVGVDPLNRTSLRLLAFAHQRLGHVDSTLHYLRMADSTLATDVTVSEFAIEEQSAEVKGIVTNLRSAPSQPFKLVFEFLNVKGEVVAKQSADVPAIPAQGTYEFDLKAIGAGIQAWRYHKE